MKIGHVISNITTCLYVIRRDPNKEEKPWSDNFEWYSEISYKSFCLFQKNTFFLIRSKMELLGNVCVPS